MTTTPPGWTAPSEGPFNAETFYMAVDARRRHLRLSWREVCRQVGIAGPSTLSRLSLHGELPSLQNCCRLLLWLGTTDLTPFITEPPPALVASPASD